MALKIFAFLVHPGRNNPAPAQISGEKLAASGKLFDLLSTIFHSTPDDRDFSVTFQPNGGTQQNDCRDQFLAFTAKPNKTNGLAIAKRLQAVTDRRSGIGLLFLMSGQYNVKKRFLASRFPADEAILAEVSANGLDVEYLERVFIKRMTAYKALMLEHQNPSAGFWNGMATDRQAGQSGENLSNYWLKDFLTADFSETPQHGTKRLAEALKAAVKSNPRIDIKEEIAAAISLAPRVLSGNTTSIDGFCKHFGLSPDATLTIKTSLQSNLCSRRYSSSMRQSLRSAFHIGLSRWIQEQF
ncbi:MAG: hypothetical protein H6915_02335 [Novosphingobium sp.]|nr:hypothetical protein [Novosphingobium sp.]